MAAREPNPQTPPPVKSDFLSLARYLRREHDRDPDAFPEEAERIGVKRRKAYYLLQIEAAFRDLPVDEDRLRRIGWTKLLHLSRVVTQEGAVTRDRCDELVSIAETQPVQAIKEMAEGKSPGNRRGMLFFFTPEEHETVIDALVHHGAQQTNYGLRGKEAALLRALRIATQT